MEYVQAAKRLTSQWGEEAIVSELLSAAGIKVNGNAPADIRIHDRRTFSRVLRDRSLGLGESYMDGWWDCQRLDEAVCRLFTAKVGERKMTPSIVSKILLARLLNLQSASRAAQVCDEHYDLGNDLFTRMLGSTMVYTCGYWRGGAKNLDEAQIAKMDLVCRKLGLQPGMRLLDIGCGFGAFMKYAAEKYGVECVGYTLSKKQYEFALELCRDLPIQIVLDDYRKIQGKFDRIVSIGMFEAVGEKNFRNYMEVVSNALEDRGIFLLHTIGHNWSTNIADPWMDKYIFPNGMLPSIAQIGKSIEKIFVVEDWHNFAPDYDRTLMEWNARFQNSWGDLKGSYSERFKRMWEFYLLSCAAGFRARRWQLWQIVMTKPGSPQPLCRLS